MAKERLLISIVEDDQPMRDSIGRLLRSYGYTVQAFSSAAEFLAFPSLEETACLVTDIHMPAMAGMELYCRLVETGRKLPTILITAYPDEAVRLRALANGVVCYLEKPFDDNSLIGCILLALGQPSA